MKHPSIIKFYSSFHDRKNLYFLLEVMPNGSLHDFLKREQIISIKLAKQFIAEIVNSLAYLRMCQIIHRDMKPGNILLDKNYHLKMIDFATAKVLDPLLSAKIPKKKTAQSDHSR